MDELGARIKEQRQARGMTLKELGEKTGYSVSFLSMVERGRSSLSISSLQTIAAALGVPVTHFFPPPQSATCVVRKKQRKQFRLENSTITYASLTGSLPNKLLEPLMVSLPPGYRSISERYRHPGEEFAYVLRGTLTMLIEGLEYRLGPGDSVHFGSDVTHTWENRGKTEVRAIWVVTPKIF